MTKRSESFRRAREAFDEMEPEDQAAFLAEATASAVARGAEVFGRTLADEIEQFFEGGTRRRGQKKEPAGPGPAEPETAQQRTSGAQGESGSEHDPKEPQS